MSTGGWGAVEYFEIFQKALVFSPKVVVVAFYTGNDPLESFLLAYSRPRWEALRPDRSLSAADGPKIPFPPPESTWWPVTFPDGVSTVFTPELRLSSNSHHPAAKAGYGIMAKVAQAMAASPNHTRFPQGIGSMRLVFTIIPTKELVYAEKIRRAQLETVAAYDELIARESANAAALATILAGLPHATYVDVIEPLQQAALNPRSLYPNDHNGHPLSPGYAVIAETLAFAARPLMNDVARREVPLALGIHRAD
jgi:hypothetical protein